MKPTTAAVQLTFWSEASRERANPSASPGNSELKRTSVISGPSSRDSSESADPVGSLLRTCLASELSRLTKCSRTWKRQATPAGRSWWVLTTLERRTGGSGCGLSPGSDWPTVTANESATRTNCGGSNGRVGPERPMLAGAVMLWPTATQQDSRQSGAAAYSTESGRHSGTTLTDAAAGLWASPQAQDSKQNGDRPHSRLYPTPKAADGRSKGTGGTADHGLDAMARAGLLDQGSSSTSGKSRDWPTANAADGTGGKRARKGSTLTGRLPDGTKANVGLRMAIDVTEARPRGVLNSRWVLQLMGYPSTWCDLPAEVIARLSRRRGTPSSRL